MLCTWDIHGVHVRMDSELGVPPVLEYGLRHHRCEDHREAHIRMHVRLGTAKLPPAQGTQVRFVRTWPVNGVVSAERFWLAAGGGSVDGDLTTGAIDVAATDAEWLTAPTVVRTLLPLGIMLQLARRGLFHVHAAIVVDPEGEGWMLVGGGGVGKSTTTYRLLERGWSCLCDDGALLAFRDGRIVGLSFWDELQLDRTMADRLGGVEWQIPPSSATGKGAVATDRIFPGRRIDRTEISRLVILRRAESHVEPANARIVGLAALIDDNRLVLVNATEANFDVLARLVGQCRLGSAVTGARMLSEPEAVLAEADDCATRRMALTAGRG